ncbi:hypothetical protein FPV67DRAFT_232309 [Lyophyllum atratum]|nr:hypothetical protein FPV67DRAFT_232309 [Lyophyllum atratum]
MCIVSGSVGLSVAAFLTVLRLAIRLWRRARLAWDDAFAIMAMLLLVLTGVVGKLYYSLSGSSSIPQHSRVTLFYLSAVTFDLVIWTSRLSILSTIMMFGFYTRYLKMMAGLFWVAMSILVAQVFWVCEPQNRHNHWKDAQHPQCALGDGVAIAQITTDAFADVVLVVSPLLILRHLRSEEAKSERVRLSASFAVGGLTTIVSIVHAYYLFNDDLQSIIVGSVEMSVSVIICNFTVLAAALHRLWRKYGPRPQRSIDHAATVTLRFDVGARPEGSAVESNMTSSGLESSSGLPTDGDVPSSEGVFDRVEGTVRKEKETT